MLAVETEGLTKRYKGRPVVQDLALAVPMGCVYGFLGPNGAGKTTAMRMLLGLVRPDAGSVHLLGRHLDRQRLAALGQVGALIESPSLYEHLSGRANLEITRGLLGLPKTEIDRVLEIVDLRAAARARVGTYSLGMKQRLALARALLGSPPLLLLDEPTNGLDPDGIIDMRELIRTLPEQNGGTVFMSSHMLAEVEHVATFAGLMNAGRMVLQGSVRALVGDARITRIELDDPARGAALISATGTEVMERTDNVLRLRCPDHIDARYHAASVNRLLVEAGLAVSVIVPEARTLEQVYRDAFAVHAEEEAV